MNSIKNRPNNSEYFKLRFIIQIQYVVIKVVGSGNGKQYIECSIDISAGSANLASYLSGQKGRNYTFYREYSDRKEYMGLGEFIHHHSFLNLDYIYSTLSNSDGENPLDYEKIASNPMGWYVAGTNAITGVPQYFDKSNIRQDDYNILKASSAIPVVCKPQIIDNAPYFDGALGNPLPIKKRLTTVATRLC